VVVLDELYLQLKKSADTGVPFSYRDTSRTSTAGVGHNPYKYKTKYAGTCTKFCVLDFFNTVVKIINSNYILLFHKIWRIRSRVAF